MQTLLQRFHLRFVPTFVLALIALTVRLVLLPSGDAAAAGPNAVRLNAGFTTNALARNDDGSTGLQNLGFSVCFYGPTFDRLFVNNNGNVTFDAPLTTYTPFSLSSTARKIIAPFFADVDTRGALSQLVTYGIDTVNGRPAFGVNWVNVGYFGSNDDLLNSFQLVLIDRSDTGAGNFDFELNYDRILWETGDASGGVNGFGGSPARAGYSNGTGAAGSFYEFAGSAVTRSLIDSNLTTGLIHGTLNAGGQLGRYVFSVRGCSVVGGPTSPPIVQPVLPTPTAGPQNTCRVVSENAQGMFTANVADNTVPEGDVFCRIIARDSRYITGPAEIGVPSVIDLGVIQAVDVFGMHRSGRPVVPFAFPVRVCLRGAGRLLFLNAVTANRTVEGIGTMLAGDYVCADLPNSGTLVLVPPDPTQPSVPVTGRGVGADCRATTLAMLNLRAEPTAEAAVLEVLPYDLGLQVTERVEDWVRVIYQDGQGWLSLRYVRLSGAC